MRCHLEALRKSLHNSSRLSGYVYPAVANEQQLRGNFKWHINVARSNADDSAKWYCITIVLLQGRQASRNLKYCHINATRANKP